MRSVDEPFRGANFSRFKLSFYRRGISGYADCFEEKIDYLIVMKRGDHNRISYIDSDLIHKSIRNTIVLENEGITALPEDDPLRININEMDTLKGTYSTLELEVVNGLENVDISIKLITQVSHQINFRQQFSI